ncbi:hypothetical protein [Rickettsiella massiliensis]|nr:hypothetical protein [Rickettsiella massiliensis]
MNSIATHFHQLLPWINQYGSIVIFVLLALGIIALPIPERRNYLSFQVF